MIMPESIPFPLLTPELAQRMIAAERDCMVDWLRAIEAVDGNPFGIAIRQFGQATALVCSQIPAEVFNRVIGMTVEDRAHLPAILSFYREHGVTPLFDLSPYAIPPFWVQPNLPPLLARHGFYQGAFHQMLYAAPTRDVPQAALAEALWRRKSHAEEETRLINTPPTIAIEIQFGQNCAIATTAATRKPVPAPTNGIKLSSPVIMPIRKPKLRPVSVKPME